MGSSGVVFEYGAGASVRLQSNGNIHQFGTNQIAVGGREPTAGRPERATN
jgi:hypothetical protein